MMKLPRRSICAMIAAVPVASTLSALPAPALDLEGTLRASLAQLPLPMPPAQLDLIRFEQTATAGQTHLSAVVRLTWAPGQRQRRFEAVENSPEQALQTLTQAIQTNFAQPA